MVIVLTGKNTHELQSELQRVVSEFAQKHGDSVERFDALELESPDEVLDAVRSLSLLEPQKLVVVRDFGQNKELFDIVEDIIEQTADSTTLVLIDAKLDKRTTIYKKLQQQTDFRTFNELEARALEQWVVQQATQQGAQMGSQEARLLIERLGSNQQLLAREIEKLALHNQKITKKTIEKLVESTPQSKIFDLLDALFAGRSEEAWAMYQDQRQQGEEPQKIMAMIVWQLQQLTRAVFAPDKTQKTLVKSGMSPYTAQKSIKLAARISRDDLRYFIGRLAELDAESKTNADIESALAVFFSEVGVQTTFQQ